MFSLHRPGAPHRIDDARRTGTPKQSHRVSSSSRWLEVANRSTPVPVDRPTSLILWAGSRSASRARLHGADNRRSGRVASHGLDRVWPFRGLFRRPHRQPRAGSHHECDRPGA